MKKYNYCKSENYPDDCSKCVCKPLSSDAMLNKVGELLPCPFCGGKAEVHFGRNPNEIDEFVYCINRYCNTTKNSIAEWNKRANFT
jgi:hypothetical protein